jgi:hypothetical protein
MKFLKYFESSQLFKKVDVNLFNLNDGEYGKFTNSRKALTLNNLDESRIKKIITDVISSSDKSITSDIKIKPIGNDFVFEIRINIDYFIFIFLFQQYTDEYFIISDDKKTYIIDGWDGVEEFFKWVF